MKKFFTLLLVIVVSSGMSRAYNIAFEDGSENTDKVILSTTSADAGETVTLTPVDGYEIFDLMVLSDVALNKYTITLYYWDTESEVCLAQAATLPYQYTYEVGSDAELDVAIRQCMSYGYNVDAAKIDDTHFRITVSGEEYLGDIYCTYSYKDIEGAPQSGELSFAVTCTQLTEHVERHGLKDPETGAYSFQMPAGDVTLIADIDKKQATALETSQEPRANSQILIKDNHLFILRGGMTYTVTGAEVR